MATLQMLQAARALIGHAYVVIVNHCGDENGRLKALLNVADRLVENHLNWQQQVEGQQGPFCYCNFGID